MVATQPMADDFQRCRASLVPHDRRQAVAATAISQACRGVAGGGSPLRLLVVRACLSFTRRAVSHRLLPGHLYYPDLGRLGRVRRDVADPWRGFHRGVRALYPLCSDQSVRERLDADPEVAAPRRRPARGRGCVAVDDGTGAVTPVERALRWCTRHAPMERFRNLA